MTLHALPLDIGEYRRRSWEVRDAMVILLAEVGGHLEDPVQGPTGSYSDIHVPDPALARRAWVMALAQLGIAYEMVDAETYDEWMNEHYGQYASRIVVK